MTMISTYLAFAGSGYTVTVSNQKPTTAPSPNQDKSDYKVATTVALSDEGKALSSTTASEKDSTISTDTPSGDESKADATSLSDDEKRQLEALKARDAEVRTHEQAHIAAGGQYAGAASYTFEKGPDGQNYAVGGEVPIDVSVIPGDPQATLIKMQQVYQAALAPAEPSTADRQIAADAQSKMSAARLEKVQQAPLTDSHEKNTDTQPQQKEVDINSTHTLKRDSYYTTTASLGRLVDNKV